MAGVKPTSLLVVGILACGENTVEFRPNAPVSDAATVGDTGFDVGSVIEDASAPLDAAPMTLLGQLRAGGLTIFFRHASADVCSDKPGPGAWWKSCDNVCATATARQLNDTGRMEAVAIGNAFRAQGIPVGRVVTSEFCRATETAEKMAFKVPTEQDFGLSLSVADESKRCDVSFSYLRARPAVGNTIVIGHTGFPPSCDPINGLQWGDAAIFRPNAMGAPTFVKILKWNEWALLGNEPVDASAE